LLSLDLNYPGWTSYPPPTYLDHYICQRPTPLFPPFLDPISLKKYFIGVKRFFPSHLSSDPPCARFPWTSDTHFDIILFPSPLSGPGFGPLQEFSLLTRPFSNFLRHALKRTLKFHNCNWITLQKFAQLHACAPFPRRFALARCCQ